VKLFTVSFHRGRRSSHREAQQRRRGWVGWCQDDRTGSPGAEGGKRPAGLCGIFIWGGLSKFAELAIWKRFIDKDVYMGGTWGRAWICGATNWVKSPYGNISFQSGWNFLVERQSHGGCVKRRVGTTNGDPTSNSEVPDLGS